MKAAQQLHSVVIRCKSVKTRLLWLFSNSYSVLGKHTVARAELRNSRCNWLQICASFPCLSAVDSCYMHPLWLMVMFYSKISSNSSSFSCILKMLQEEFVCCLLIRGSTCVQSRLKPLYAFGCSVRSVRLNHSETLYCELIVYLKCMMSVYDHYTLLKKY